MTKDEKRRKYCPGCEDNFYNGKNPYGVKECWNLSKARPVFKKKVPLSQAPPWNQKRARVLECHHEKGYAFLLEGK